MQVRDNKKQVDEYVFLPVTCPKCGLEGKVRTSRSYCAFNCKQCHRNFYVTASGSITSERPPELQVGPYGYDPYGPASGSPDDGLTRRLQQLPRSVWWGFGGLCVAGMALALAWPLLAEPAAGVPESLDGRAEFMADAVARAEYRRLKAVVARGKHAHALEWARSIRPAEWPAAFEAEQNVSIQLDTLFKNSNREAAPTDGQESPVATAGILATIIPPGNVRPISLLLFWAQDTELQWMLDITRTAKEGTR